MNNEQTPLQPHEFQILKEILQTSGAVGRLVPVFILNNIQRSALSELEKKGYVTVSMGNFAVTKMPDISN
jgi:hypothetical protein